MTGNTVPGGLIPTPISLFPQAPSVGGSDLILIVHNGTTYRATIAQALAAAGAAPVAATYFTMTSDPDLTAERVLSFSSTQFSAVDNGAGLTYTVALNYAGVATPVADAVAASIGSSLIPAHSDHAHPINVSNDNPQAVTGSAATGSSPYYARIDHQHGAPPAFVGASAGVDGTLGGVTKPLAGEQLYHLRGDGVWAPAPGTGTVTSVALSMPSIFSVAGSPITTSGTFAVTLATEVANTVFSGPGTGADAAPTFRALVAADIPNLDASKITTGQLVLARGGTNASLTASTGGIVYSGASALAILAGTATGNQMLQSGASAAPAWSTATWPATTTVNQLLYSSSANTVAGLATANSGVLITSGGGVPSISSTIPSATQDNITRTGTLVSGATGAGFTVNIGVSTISGVLLGANGGTGVANTGSTITLGGNLTLAGAFGLTLTQTALTNVTLPTTGTLATLAGTEGLSNKAITASTYQGALGGVTPAAAAVTTFSASGVATFANGAVGAPGITFANQATDGIYSPSAGNLAIVIGGKTLFALGVVGATGNSFQFNANNTPAITASGPGAAVPLAFVSKGTSPITLGTGGGTQVSINDTASAVNTVGLTGAVTGGSPTISATGSDANPSLALAAKAAGVIRLQSLLTTPQATPATKTTATTLTAAEILAGLILANPGGAANVNYTLPLGTDLEAALPADFGTARAFFFSINNISVVVTETVTVVGNTGTTLSGGGGILSNSALGVVSSARFEVVRTAASTFTIYRVG